MERKSKDYFDLIDVENLFSQWHRDVKLFTSNLNQECALKIIKTKTTSSYDIQNHKELFNFTNTVECKSILQNVLAESNVGNFLNILKERDNLHPRSIDRGYTIEELFNLVKSDDYHPLLFLELNKNFYIIDGRTRLYCCLFLNKPAKVRIVTDKELNESCKQ